MNLACQTTSKGEGAISIIEVIGPDAKRLIEKLGQTPFSIPNKSYHTKLSYNGGILDETICRHISKKESFTGENTIEICCHGGIMTAKKILDALFGLGIKEITQEELVYVACRNKKVDVIQAEAMKLLPYAKTELVSLVLLDQYNGALSKAIAGISSQKDVGDLPATANFGLSLVTPQKITIVGEPNVGKSTLFNTLLGIERVVVDATAGTTRDPISEIISIKGIPFELTDTAGIDIPRNELEKLSIERTKQKIAEAHLILLMHDKVPHKEPYDFEDKKKLVIFNKADLWCISPSNSISALHGDGIEELKEKILSTLKVYPVYKNGQPVIFTERQKHILESALSGERIESVKDKLLWNSS